jgi:hypothetical protein
VADAPEAVADDLGLGRELRLVVELLEVAAAAAPEVRAGRLDARGRGREDFDERGEEGLAARPLDADAEAVARRGEPDEDGLPVGVREPDPARQDALDRHLQRRALAPARRLARAAASAPRPATRRLSATFHKTCESCIVNRKS